MTATELLSGLRPITVECIDTFAPFYAERAKHYVYPRYMQSVCALVDMGHVFYKIIRAAHGSVLVIFKRTKIFGKLGVQMPIPPISLSGSVSDEKEIMQAALRVGISLRVTTEDISRYHIPQRLCSDGTGPLVPVNNEYIYNGRKGSEMRGSQYRKQRYQVKRITQSEGFSLSSGAHPQADALVADWDRRYKEKNGTQTDQSHLWAVIKTAVARSQSSAVQIRNIIIRDRLECVSVLERLSEGQFVIVFRVRNYKSELNDVGSAIHWTDCSESLRPTGETYLNMGLADTEGLIRSKESLNPCRHQKIYTVKTTKTNTTILNQYFK